MKRCQMCGSAMRLDAELVEGQRQYLWYKCTHLACGAIFLIQRQTATSPPVVSEAPLNSTTV